MYCQKSNAVTDCVATAFVFYYLHAAYRVVKIADIKLWHCVCYQCIHERTLVLHCMVTTSIVRVLWRRMLWLNDTRAWCDPLPLLLDNSSAFPACIITSKCPTLIHWLCSRDKIRMFVLSVVRPRVIVTWLRCLCMTDLLLCNSACAPHPGHCWLKWHFLVSPSWLRKLGW